ncbi:MAG: LysM peptidoglycan-binding domain-containing protein, partial [Kiritimatiellia bacterium]
AVSAAPPRTRPADGAAPDAGAAETVAYVVKSGDTLFGLAREFSCTASELARLNNTDVRKLSNLKRGQTIRVPKAGAARPAK